MTAMTSVPLPKPVSTDLTIKSDSVLTNPNLEAGCVVSVFYIKLKHKVILSIFANWFLPKALLKIYISQTTLKHGIMALRHCIENWKVSGSNCTSLCLFHMKTTASVTKSSHQDHGSWYLNLPIFFLYIHSPVLLQNQKFLSRPSQIASTIMTMNVTCTPNNLTHTQKSLHCIDFFLSCPWMILSCITSCDGHKLWKLSTVS